MLCGAEDFELSKMYSTDIRTRWISIHSIYIYSSKIYSPIKIHDNNLSTEYPHVGFSSLAFTPSYSMTNFYFILVFIIPAFFPYSPLSFCVSPRLLLTLPLLTRNAGHEAPEPLTDVGRPQPRDVGRGSASASREGRLCPAPG